MLLLNPRFIALTLELIAFLQQVHLLVLGLNTALLSRDGAQMLRQFQAKLLYDIIFLALRSLSLLLADLVSRASQFDSFELTLLQLQAPLHLLYARLQFSCLFLQTFDLFLQFGLLTSQVLLLRPKTGSLSRHLSFELLIGRAHFLQLLLSLLQGKLKVVD